MLKVLTIIGARPQIIKSAALSRAIRTSFKASIKEVIVHTGQHYDQNMSEVFFEEMHIPKPNYNLNARSGSHGVQTAAMLTGIEDILLKEKPDCLVVYGDTNSTLAGALAASKIHIPVVHIEAGLRSHNKKMPEEINRILCDHVSTLLFSPSEAGFENLMKEGFEEGAKPPYQLDNPRIYKCGDIMFDNSLHFASIATDKSEILTRLSLIKDQFILITIHRDYNTDQPARLQSILKALETISSDGGLEMVIPLHPRTLKILEGKPHKEFFAGLQNNPRFRFVPPVSFLDMVLLEKNARLIMTDSGGVQKEAFFFKKPCLILRSETEWVELVQNGNARIVDADEVKIAEGYAYFSSKTDFTYPSLYGDGKTAEFICGEILRTFSKA